MPKNWRPFRGNPNQSVTQNETKGEKMAKLTIVANITAKEDKIELIQSELLKLIEPTRAEAGCIGYDLHQDNENPAHFVFLENWESEELLLQHVESEHFKAYAAASEGAVAEFTVNKLTQIG
jgi:quinol monooxygenase YgiN